MQIKCKKICFGQQRFVRKYSGKQTTEDSFKAVPKRIQTTGRELGDMLKKPQMHTNASFLTSVQENQRSKRI